MAFNLKNLEQMPRSKTGNNFKYVTDDDRYTVSQAGYFDLSSVTLNNPGNATINCLCPNNSFVAIVSSDGDCLVKLADRTYQYFTADTIADVTASGYFAGKNYSFDADESIKVQASDGPYEVQLVGGVASVVSSPAAGITSDVTWTVGTGGNFSTINEAQAFYLSLGKGLTPSNPKVTINLLSGFVMAEQVIVDGINLSGCTITSDDAEVTIQRSALAATNITNLDYNSTPAFLAVNGGQLPNIGVLFNMDTSGSADSAKQHGVMAAWGGKVVVLQGAGVKNATGRGLYLVNGFAYARGSIWDGAGTRGIRAGNGSVANVRDCSATGCGEYNLAIGGGSTVTATSADFSGGLGTNVLVDNASTLNADGMNCSGATVNCMDVKFSSKVNAYAADFSAGASTVRAVDITSSCVEMETADCTGYSASGATPIVVNRGSDVNAQSVNATTTGNTVAVSCTASRLNFKNGTASSTGGQPIRCFDGSVIVATGSTGGFNLTANTPDPEGIIFK